MAKVFTIPVKPSGDHLRKPRNPDPRYLEGQRLLAEAIKYLTQTGPRRNRAAIEFLSEHFRTQFRMSDWPSQ